MRDKIFFNSKIFSYINPDMKAFVERSSSKKDNSFNALGSHHVIHDALCLLYEKKTGKKFDNSKLNKACYS